LLIKSNIIYTPSVRNIYIPWLFLNFCFSGTGSYPPLEKGLHLKIRQIANALPLIAPCTSIASIAYEEQVGINRQQEGFAGEMFF